MKPRILFLDDDEPIGELISTYFGRKGCDVVAVRTGSAALREANRRPFDLAIFDINLAGENGLELLGDFKTRFPDLPVVMFTGMVGEDRDDLVEQARLRGASGFMCKTDPLDDLFAAVKAYLPAA